MSSQKKEDSAQAIVLPRATFTVEFWVGVFSLLGVGCFAYLAINIAGMHMLRRGYYHVTASFTNVSGLKVGAPVEIAGVQVGEVSNVVLNKSDAVVTLEIREGVVLREDDIAQIRTKGIIGDRYVKISPGGADAVVSNRGQLTDTESAVEFEEVLGKIIHGLEKN